MRKSMQAIRIVRSFLSEIKRDNISAHAASAAFFIFLSVIPILILITSILPYTPIQEAALMTAVTDVLPTSMDAFAVSLINEIYGKSIAIISITAVATIWAASKGILALIRALNAINEVHETRNYFILRFKASVDTLALLVIIIISLLVMVFGNQLLSMIEAFVPSIYFVISIIMHFRFVIVWFVLVFFFVLLYVWLPNKHPKIRSQIFGACFTSTGWLIFSYVFSLYIDKFSGYSMYGSLSTITIVMIWLYTCMYIMMLGAEFNSMFDEDLKHFELIRRVREKKREIAAYKNEVEQNVKQKIEKVKEEKGHIERKEKK